MLKHVNLEDFEEEVLNSSKVILVDFFATWCGPCKMLSPILEEISEIKENFDIAKIDIDENTELAEKYGIESVPTMIIFKDGEILNRIVGLYGKNEIIEMVEKYL